MNPRPDSLDGGNDTADYAYNDTRFFLEPDPPDHLNRDPLYIVLPITIIYGAIFLTGIIGNISTCVVIARNKHMHTATNYYLFSLAVSDLLLLLSGLPPEMYVMWRKHSYVFGETFCILQSFAAETSANATVLTITAFTVERYVAICHPFQSHTLSKLSRAVKLVVAIWLLALGLAIPQAIQYGIVSEPSSSATYCTIKKILIQNAFVISTCLFFVAPMTVITVLYILIGVKLRRSRLISVKRPSVNEKNMDVSRHRNSAAQSHVIKMLGDTIHHQLGDASLSDAAGSITLSTASMMDAGVASESGLAILAATFVISSAYYYTVNSSLQVAKRTSV